jgi:GNAT superfamily N-acetyltransferase
MPLREADAPAAAAVSGVEISRAAAARSETATPLIVPSLSLDALVIRDYGSSESIPEMTLLLREAYAHLAGKGLRYLATYQDDAMTARRLGRGFPFVVYLEGRLVGTATLYPPRPDLPVEWYRRPEVVHFGQFGVHPELQRQGIGVRMLRALEDRARARGARELACDTAEQAEHLRAWYAREGFRVVGATKWPVTNFQSVVLSKTISPL